MIKLTHYYEDRSIYIDPHKVVGVTRYDKNTTEITTSGGSGYLVAESPEEVVKMIEEAIG